MMVQAYQRKLTQEYKAFRAAAPESSLTLKAWAARLIAEARYLDEESEADCHALLQAIAFWARLSAEDKEYLADGLAEMREAQKSDPDGFASPGSLLSSGKSSESWSAKVREAATAAGAKVDPRTASVAGVPSSGMPSPEGGP